MFVRTSFGIPPLIQACEANICPITTLEKRRLAFPEHDPCPPPKKNTHLIGNAKNVFWAHIVVVKGIVVRRINAQKAFKYTLVH